MNTIKTGVIPAAGAGKRMGYLSQILPKCLFPLYDRPIIHHIVNNMKNVGIEQIYVIVNYQKDKIIEYFRNVRDEIGVNIDFIEQKKLSGIADAIMQVSDYVDNSFMVILGDDCSIVNSLGNLISTFFKHDAIVVEGIVQEENEELLKSTCCARLDNDKRILEIVEKPQKPVSNLRGCGIYIFKKEIFNYIGKTPVSPVRNEVEITQTIDLVAKEKRAYGELLDGLNININSYHDLLQAWILVKELRASNQPVGLRRD